MSVLETSSSERATLPSLSIIDAHQHFWGLSHGGAKLCGQFLPDDLAADIVSSGQQIAATVYVDCGWAFRPGGPKMFRCVGETEYVEAVAKKWATHTGMVGKLGAGIVARADLMLGHEVAPVLEAHIAASPTHFRGIRELLASDPDIYQSLNIPPGKSRDARFRAGFAQLAGFGLSCDILCAHTMLAELNELAQAFPETVIILNHIAGPIGIGRFRDKRQEVFADWRAKIVELARYPNVMMKLSGFGADLMGFGWNQAAIPPTSEALANAFYPYVVAAIDAFSPSRCMFASNFPIDRLAYSYGVLWNAFKRVAAGYSMAERHELFFGTAARVYRLVL